MFVDGTKHGREENQEADVLMRRLTRLEKILSVELGGIRRDRHRPVAVLSRAIDARERFFVENGLQPVTERDTSESRHHQHVVVDGEIGLLEVRRHLKLARRDFVMSGRYRNSELVKLKLDLRDARLDTLGNAAKVVVLELLAARWRCADERASAHHEVRAQAEVCAVDQEVFLLGAEGGENPLDALVAEELEELNGFLGENIGAAEQRRHLVESFAVVADEHRRDAERARARGFDDEYGTGRIPRGVAASFPGC